MRCSRALPALAALAVFALSAGLAEFAVFAEGGLSPSGRCFAAVQGETPRGRATRLGQVASPVGWRMRAYPRAPVRAGKETQAVAEATIGAGWHMYALSEPEDGPVPLEFSVRPGGPLILVSVGADRPRRGPVAGTASPVDFYVGQPRFRLRLRAGEGAVTGPTVVEIRFQACNDSMCLPPRVATLPLPAGVVRLP